MGRYISEADVKGRLTGKVKYTDDPNDGNALQNTLLRDWISQAESQVEIDFSPRYAAPFAADDGTPFSKFPQLAAKDGSYFQAYHTIRRLCQILSVILVLESDFGRGSVATADKYIDKLEDRYKSIVEDKLLAKKKMPDGSETQQWQFPPLPHLQLNYHNNMADDGFMGQVLTTTQVEPQFPQFQINDPSENFWNGIFDDPQHSPGAVGSNGSGPFDGSGDS